MGAARREGQPRNRGRELACLRGGLEWALWSGLPGAQVRMSPELLFPPRRLPTLCIAREQGEGSLLLSPGMLENTQLRLSFLFKICPGILREMAARPGGHGVSGGWAGLLATSCPGPDLWVHRSKEGPTGWMGT